MMKSKTLAYLLGSAALLCSMETVQAEGAQIAYAPASGAVIRYPWKITMSANDTVEFARHVGAKSADEPAQEAPLKGWTHFTDWVHLTLNEPALLTVEINAQPGLHYTTFNSETNVTTDLVAGDSLYPASSIYEGVDTTTEVGHMYNPHGNFSANINFLHYAENTAGSKNVSYKVLLKPGQYSLTVAGVNAKYCQADDPCFNGRHGYRAKLTTEPTPVRLP